MKSRSASLARLCATALLCVPAGSLAQQVEATPPVAAPTAAAAAPVAPATAPVAPAEAPQPVITAVVVAQPAAAPVADDADSEEPEADYLAEQARLNGDHAVNLDKIRFRPGKGLHLESEDGDFALATRLRAQLRYEAESGPAWTETFQVRRARLQFGGHFFGKDNTFKAELAVSPADVGMRNTAPSTSPLLDWYFHFKQLRDLNLRVGQYKVPYSRQRVISSGDLRMVDRSIVNAEFNVDRDIGGDIRSEDFLGLEVLRYYLGVYAGEGRNTNNAADFGMMYLGRLEFLPFGDFDDYKEADLERSAAPKLSLGLGYAYIAHATHSRGILGSEFENGTTDFHNFTADAVFRLRGFSVETEFAMREGDPASASMGPAANGFGWMGQAGYLLPNCGFEVVARAGLNRATDDSSMSDRNEYGLGLNYYFANHPYKLQADYFRNSERKPGADKYAYEQVVRVQLQAGL